jgi:DNA-binding NtrC family response regulator
MTCGSNALGIRKVLVVDDDKASVALVAEWARGIGCEVVEQAATLAAARHVLARSSPQLVVCEALLPEGDCLPVVRAARGLADPAWVIAVSLRANQALIGEINQVGGVYTHKPLHALALSKLVESLTQGEQRCRAIARELVGCLGLKEAQDVLRDEMYSEALARTGGNRRRAARILGVDRRCVQRLADEVAARNVRSGGGTAGGA